MISGLDPSFLLRQSRAGYVVQSYATRTTAIFFIMQIITPSHTTPPGRLPMYYDNDVFTYAWHSGGKNRVTWRGVFIAGRAIPEHSEHSEHSEPCDITFRDGYASVPMQKHPCPTATPNNGGKTRPKSPKVQKHHDATLLVRDPEDGTLLNPWPVLA